MYEHVVVEHLLLYGSTASTAQHSTAQHSTAQRSAAQRSAISPHKAAKQVRADHSATTEASTQS